MLKLYGNVENRLKTMPASTKYHQSWKGGLYDHILQVMTIALEFYEKRKRDFMMKIDIDDIILVTFLHDFDKLDKYVENPRALEPGENPFIWNYDKIDVNEKAQILNYLIPYGISLTDQQLNAISYSHGGWSREKGRMGILATILHCADLWSTNILAKVN